MSVMEEVNVVPGQWTEYSRNAASPVVIWASGSHQVLVKIGTTAPTNFKGCDILNPQDREEYAVEASDRIWLRSLTWPTKATVWRGS